MEIAGSSIDRPQGLPHARDEWTLRGKRRPPFGRNGRCVAVRGRNPQA
jgi:hypothetical protein